MSTRGGESRGTSQVTSVRAEDLPELLPLMRALCDFYDSHPPDEGLVAISRALLDDPQREGIQFLARSRPTGQPAGFATLYWSWETNAGGRIGVMNDLFVTPADRGQGHAEGLIAACVQACRRHRAVELTWQTALDNHRAQAVYDRVGARRSKWLDYKLELGREPPEPRHEGSPGLH